MFTTQDIQGKKVLLRADLDISLKDGRVENTFRLQKLLPTLNLCLKSARQVCLIGHLGRPKSPSDSNYSLLPIKNELERLINQTISFISSGYSPGDWWKGGNPLTLLDNLRFDSREEKLDREFATQLSTEADIYIYEAFATYRPCTSLSLIPEVLPTLTGLQFDQEIETLNHFLNTPERPTLLIGSGAKPDKRALLESLIPRFDNYFFGGIFAHTEDLTPDGLDLNPLGTNKVLELISRAKTIVLNGPLGRYEDGVHLATQKVLQALTDPQKHTILGGGNTLSAIPHLGLDYTQYGFVSTGGGAMLDYLATLTHPLLAILNS